jgi:hypothetical protein
MRFSPQWRKVADQLAKTGRLVKNQPQILQGVLP